jgi:HK97 family phage major capsid protein
MDKLKRIGEIGTRLAALLEELKTATAERIAQISEEQRTLTAERTQLRNELEIEARATFNGGTPVVPQNHEDRDEVIANMSKRQKICLLVGKYSRGKKLTDVEKRTLGTALTTTATTYVAATESVDGANNAGVLISTKLILELLKEEGKLSPILADINFLAVPGLVDFPFRKSRTKANAKAEGAEGTDHQMEWDKLSLVKGYLQTIIPVTDEVRALTDFDFGEYVINAILQDINEDWVEDLIYGAGSGDHIKGLTIGATVAVAGGYVAGTVTDALIKGIKACKGKYRRGAKIYAAQDVADEVLFAVDDNGNFKYPVFNNTTGISSIGPIRLEVDENLHEGDFIIGNVNKYFKVNSLIPLRIETNRLTRKGVTEYIASEYCASAPFVGAYIYGSKKA